MSKRIGKYEITAEIGRGGFSRVYRGFDPNVNRPVAVKVSTRESDPEHLSRFRNEAFAAGNLRHENIVTIHDYGDDDGLPYLVMELLEGRDLHHIMRDGPKLSLVEKMQVMSQVGEGLRCAHSNGIVHRDIKPANVMLLTDGTVKILDFGIARMTGEVSRLTQSGYLVGTPLYMSPEQLQGGDADALCDVWAFGVLYFELLTGQHPFLSQDNTRLIRNITIVNPPSVHSLTRGVPEGLAQVIRRALTKDRRRRYQSIEEVLVDTNPILALMQREQTAGLVTEAQFHRNSGRLAAARQTSRRALEIDPSNYGAQQLLKSIQHEMHVESFNAPEDRPAPAPVSPAPVAPAPVAANPLPPVAVVAPVVTPVVAEARPQPAIVPPPPPAVRANVPPPPVVEEDLPEMIFPDDEPEPVVPLFPTPDWVRPASVVPAPPVSVRPVASSPVAVATPLPSPLPASPVSPVSPAAAALVKAPVAPAEDTPVPAATPRLRPAMASGAAAAIAAAVAAAKARQAEEERQQKESKPAEEETAPPIKATPLVVSALPSRVVPAPQPTASLKRAENGSGVFLTEDPLVVKRPAAAVMSQRMNAADSSAAVATPVPAPPPPPTRLPGTKAIPASVPRSLNGTAEVKPPVPSPAVYDSRRLSENLPMRRPPSEVYAKGKRRSSSAIFAEKNAKKPFPWAVVGFVAAVALAAVAIVLFALQAPKLVNTPVLQPEKMAFSWKPGTPNPDQQVLKLKGGSASSSFTASSSDEEWLTVTPVSDEPTNRSWQIKVDPEKVGPTGPNGTSGWIDVSSTEGFKTSEEVILKVADAGPAKAKKTPVPATVTPAVVPTVPAPTAKKPAAAANPLADSSTAAPPKMPTTKPAATTAKPVVTPTKKQPANDGADIN